MAARQALSTPVTLAPHSCASHLSSACTMPAARHALITLLGSQQRIVNCCVEVLEGVRNQQRRGAVDDAVLAGRHGRELRVGHQVHAARGFPLLLIRQLVADEPDLHAYSSSSSELSAARKHAWCYLNLPLAESRRQHGRDLGGVSQEEHVAGAPGDHVEHGGHGQARPVHDLGLELASAVKIHIDRLLSKSNQLGSQFKEAVADECLNPGSTHGGGVGGLQCSLLLWFNTHTACS
ncbi:hypothetical protein U9M48_021520 [Paspalum notatum var. saurae]|uniref:Uncharacterized protein n=1 Tax=Paspalum notatum var. saurae TaxID=547442 RepID=A0AAQ3TGH3_PASNO